MPNPYLVLETPETASDEVIKKAYLEKVRAHPPERDPEQFQTIRAAYEAIATHPDRLRYQLFQQALPSLDELVADALQGTAQTRPTERQFQQVLLDGLSKRPG